MKWVDADILQGNAPGLHPMVAQALLRRGINTPEQIAAFLDPSSYTPAPAKDLPGMSTAVMRLQQAINGRERICVWGDFDADGQTATTILVEVLRDLGANVTYHIPVRSVESHGVNLPNLKEIINQGTSLVITCDTGISASEAVTYAHTRRVDTIITDHHELPEILPQAVAVVNPKFLPGDHPLASLSGAGVAYKLAEELYSCFKRPGEAQTLLDITAIGLVADLALVRGETRHIIQLGLSALQKTRRLGLKIMMEKAELSPSNLTEEHIGFIIGPRLNALGRLGDANPIVELLTTQDPARAHLLANELENYNAQRQLLTSQVTQAAEAQLRDDPSLLTQPLILLSSPAWHAGVIGIAASHLVERYQKPVILLSGSGGGSLHGSARSIDGLNITAAIGAQKDILIGYGGHPMAAGLSLEQENLSGFRSRIIKTINSMLGERVHEEAQLIIDHWLELSDANLELADIIESLHPYGPGNKELILASRALTLISSTAIGRNKEHLRLSIKDQTGNEQEILYWNGAGEEMPEGKFDLAYVLRASNWEGNRKAQLTYVDHRANEEDIAHISRKTIEILDHRSDEEPKKSLDTASKQPRTVIWAEGEDEKDVNGANRFKLAEAECLIIWTFPPSPEELHQVMKRVKPERVYLFAPRKTAESIDTFIGRIAGLIKYAISHRQGCISYEDLAAMTAQRLVTVKQAVDWLVSEGHVKIIKVQGNILTFAVGTSLKDPSRSASLWKGIQTLLAESAAYREHYCVADKASLISN